MSKMMPAFASKLKRKQPTVKVQSPSDAEPEAKDTKGLVKAAYTGATQSTLQSATENAFSIRKPSSAKHTWLTAFMFAWHMQACSSQQAEHHLQHHPHRQMPLRECQSLSLRGGVPQQTEPMWPLS